MTTFHSFARYSYHINGKELVVVLKQGLIFLQMIPLFRFYENLKIHNNNGDGIYIYI